MMSADRFFIPKPFDFRRNQGPLPYSGHFKAKIIEHFDADGFGIDQLYRIVEFRMLQQRIVIVEISLGPFLL